jgi:hypothetical protein
MRPVAHLERPGADAAKVMHVTRAGPRPVWVKAIRCLTTSIRSRLVASVLMGLSLSRYRKEHAESGCPHTRADMTWPP